MCDTLAVQLSQKWRTAMAGGSRTKHRKTILLCWFCTNPVLGQNAKSATPAETSSFFVFLMTKKYRVIIADPPWGYANWSERKNGAAQAIYNTMSVEDLCKMKVSEIAEADCVLLLWSTNPKLPEALKVASAWGFEYVTKMSWVKVSSNPQTNIWGEVEYKPHYGIGFWVRGCTEDILICKRGNAKPPRADGWVGIISKQFYHSRKPDNLHEYAESMPGPYLEMFARRKREGWDVFGNQVEDSITIETS